MTTYCGYEVLDMSYPWKSVNQSPGANYEWNGEFYQKREKVVLVPAEQKIDVVFAQYSDSDRRTLKNFFDAQKGSLKPFWFPSFHNDMWVSRDCVSGTGSIYIRNNSDMIVLADSVRHAYSPGSNQRFKMSSPVMQTDGSIAISISPVLASNLASGTALQRLYFVRFAEDELVVENSDENENITFAKFSLQELQRETP